MRLLVAEDDARLLKSLLYIFKASGYAADGVENGKDALDYALSGEYDGFVCDVMMPEMDGFEVLRRLRQKGISLPTLFLTARSDIEDRVAGLDAGADDYLPKPFAQAELLARVRAMLRRKENYTPDLLLVGGVTLNRSTFEISFDGKSQTLGGKEFQILEMLMSSPSALFSTEQFVTHIWGWDTSVDTGVVWVHISNLRKKLDALGAPLRIRFVRGAGYGLEVAK